MKKLLSGFHVQYDGAQNTIMSDILDNLHTVWLHVGLLTILPYFVFRRFNRKSIVVRLLDHAQDTSAETDTIDRRVERVVIHSRYDDSTFNNDIALLRLDREVSLDSRLRPVCLPTLGTLLI